MDTRALENEIMQEEGLRLHPYTCPEGYLSIGYGRNLQTVGVSKDEAEMLLGAERAPNVPYHRLPYTNSKGHTLIGYGRNLTVDGITESEAHMLLSNSIKEAYINLINAYPFILNLDSVRKAVMVNMCYNMGIKTLKQFTSLFVALKQGDFKRASAEMLDSKWARQVKGRAHKLANQMLTGQ
jgi:lysozyme